MGYDASRDPQGAEGDTGQHSDGSEDVGMEAITPEESAQAASELQAFQTLETKRSKKKHSTRVKIIIVCIGALVLCVAALIISNLILGQAQPETVTTEPVVRGTFEKKISGTGKVDPIEAVTVSPEIDGTIAELEVAEGDSVTEGQLLFTIENSELDEQVDTAKRALDSANATLSSAKKARTNAENAADTAYEAYLSQLAAVETAKKEAAETGIPYAGGEATYDEYAAQSQIDAAQQQVDAANSSVAEAQSAYDKAVAAADKRNVYAPISGQIVSQNLERGMKLSTLATAGTSPMQIADLSKMVVTLQINEVDILDFSVGQKATVTFDALPDLESEAVVDRISTTTVGGTDAESAAGGSNVVYYEVDLLIDNPDPRLKLGMSASADVLVETLEDVLMVNATAITTADGTSTVSVQDGEGQITEVVVTVVSSDDSTAVIEGAIAEGDAVVIGGVSDALNTITGVSTGTSSSSVSTVTE